MVGKGKTGEAGLVSVSSLPEFWNVSPIDWVCLMHPFRNQPSCAFGPPFWTGLSVCLPGGHTR